MAKIPSSAKVHAYSKNESDSFWVYVEKDDTMYTIYLVYPGSGRRLQQYTVCGYEVKQQIMEMLGKMYETHDIDQINITWNYDEKEAL